MISPDYYTKKGGVKLNILIIKIKLYYLASIPWLDNLPIKQRIMNNHSEEATMNRFYRFSCVLLGFALSLAAVPGWAARDIKIGHSQTESIPMHKALLSFANEVKEKTKGELTFTIIHGGVLGGDLEMAQQIRGGMLEAYAMSGLGNIDTMAPAVDVDELPYIYKDAKTVYAAFDGEFGKRLAEKYIEPLGLKVICFLEYGFRHTINNVRPITKPDDLKGIKLRVPQQEMRVKYFSLLGANPVPIAWTEVFTVLQQGTVDGMESPLAVIQSNRFDEVTKYLSLTSHTHSTGVLVFNEQVWKSLKPEQQQIVLAAGKNAQKLCRELMENLDAQVLADFRKKGSVIINELDLKPFREAARPVWDDYVKKFGSDLLDLIPQ